MWHQAVSERGATALDPNRTVRRHALVEGRVQGVDFRSTVAEVATALELRGWIRNLTDGRVEVLVEGPEGDVLKLVSWLWTGAPSARVRQVHVAPAPASDGPLASFALAPTAPNPLV